jgi:hypothetical protein
LKYVYLEFLVLVPLVEICSFGIFGPGKWEEREYYFLIPLVEICSFGIFGPGKWEEREYYFLEGMTFPAETVIPKNLLLESFWIPKIKCDSRF